MDKNLQPSPSERVNDTGRINTEKFLTGPCRDFSAAYMGVKYLASHIQNFPDTITRNTVDALEHILESQQFARQKQVLFLYSEAADALVDIALEPESCVSKPIIDRLLALLDIAEGKRLRAISQSLGRLPAGIDRGQPSLQPPAQPEITPLDISIQTLCHAMDVPQKAVFNWKGRSLIVVHGGQLCAVIKFAHSTDNIRELVQETMWLDTFGRSTSYLGVEFPKPVKVSGRALFRIRDTLPAGGPQHVPMGACIAFIPCPGYYDYPNQDPQSLSGRQLKSIFEKNARSLGRLTGMGIFHTALIPLFHNRVQQTRRNDSGAYLWEHGGRLDRWLDSCRFPNFAASGPRDFEHVNTMAAAGQLRHYIGEHLLSFILVIGSCFRNKAPDRRGKNKNNTPVDTRDLFAPALFAELIETVCSAYFEGLVGSTCPDRMTFAPHSLIQSLIGAMGRDEHMEEVLRVSDQERMKDHEFTRFLLNRGVTSCPEKGKADIIIETGPHLGGFNQPISVPDLIDHLFRFSAFCTAHAYLARYCTSSRSPG